jgi:pimeloyl-ACP methyl ester carboxylesterase
VDVNSNGIRLHVNERGAGTPVLFLHGWMADSSVFDPLLDVILPDLPLHAITMDLRGHGDSDKPAAGYAVEEQSRDVDAALAACSVDQVTLVGWSLGGTIAQHYAATRADRVRKLVLVGATPSLVQQPGFETASPLDAFDGLLKGLLSDYPAVAGQFIAAQLPELGTERAAQLLHDAAMRTTGAAAVAVADVAGREDLRGLAAQVIAPALVLHGALDAVVPPAAGQWLAEQIPGTVRYVEWPDRGHCPLLTAPGLVADELTGFLVG